MFKILVGDFNFGLSVKFLFLATLTLAIAGCSTTETAKDSSDSHADAHTNSPVAAVAPAQDDAITLREGDTVKISFPGSPGLNTTQQIRRDGKITLPLVGEVDAAGQTPDELQQSLIKLYAPQISSKEVVVEVESSTFPIYVTGSVLHPGKISSDRPLTALEAVMEAGVDYSVANLKDVRVVRRENGISTNHVVNLKMVLDGKNAQPFYLKPGDVIFVPQKLSFF